MSTPTRGEGSRTEAAAARGRPSAENTGANAGEDVMARALARVARELQDESGLERTLHAVVASAVNTIPGAEFGGITEVRKGGQELDVRYASDQIVVDVDTAQYRLRQGPCLDAAYRHLTVRVDDLAKEDRWPAFAQRALDRGLRSMLSFQLYVERDNLGALNLYSRRAQAFDDESENVGLLFAAHAAVAVAGAKVQDQLRVGLNTRDLIGQAKGILMERYRITADQAFLVLTRASQDTNTKLHTLAEHLTATGELPRRVDAPAVETERRQRGDGRNAR